MNAIVNGHAMPPRAMTYPGMGFGQPIADGLPYALVFARDEFRSLIRAAFDDFVSEIHRDDEATCCADAIPTLLEYSYPTYDDLLRRNSEALGSLVARFLALELLDRCLPATTDPSAWRFGINTVDIVRFTEHGAEVLGLAYPIPRSSACV